MPWAYKDGKFWDEENSDDYFDQQEKAHENSLLSADEFEMIIAPVGWARKNVMQERIGVELFLPDISHPTLEEFYIIARVAFSTIFKEK